MPSRAIPYLKAAVHLLCLLPFLLLVEQFQSGALGLQADPVNYVTHVTGHWALWILLADLAITPLRRLHPSLAWLIRFRRMVGLYAFFYATLHLLIYVFLFSGYDVPTAVAGMRAGHLGEPWHQLTLAWPTILDDIEKRRFVQVGFAAWLLLLALAATSPQRVLRAMGGKNWQRLHRFIYLAAFLATVHFWWLVKAHVMTPWHATAVLYALLLARLVYWMYQRWTSRKTIRRQAAASIP